MTLASRNHSAVGDDRPPIHRHTEGRPSSVAGMSRIVIDLRRTQPHGAQECAPSQTEPYTTSAIFRSILAAEVLNPVLGHTTL